MKHKDSSYKLLRLNNAFPKTFAQNSLKNHLALVGLGANQGHIRFNFKQLIRIFEKSVFVDVVASSFILKNPAFGYIKQNDFFNAVLVIRTHLNSKALLRYLLYIEKQFGRLRSFKNAPRTMDLDLLCFDNLTIKSQFLTLPHSEFKERYSTLIPLKYLRSF